MRKLALAVLCLGAVSCAPIVATRPIQNAATDDVAFCAARTLESLGYSLLRDWGPKDAIRGERDKHARNPFSGAVDNDQITIYFDEEKMRIVGLTLRSGHPTTFRRFPAPSNEPASYTGSTFPMIPSKEVRNDVERIAETCG